MADMPVITSGSGSLMVSSIPASSIMLTMDSNGANVRIDWSEVEKQATGADAYLRCVAIALLAVRDQTYKPLAQAHD